MSSLKHKLKTLHRRHSKRHVLLLFLVLLMFLGASGVARYYAFVPLRLMDASMAPGFKERSVIWMCKLPHCLTSFKEGDVVWASLRGNEKMIRKVLAQPGDTIQINDNGLVTTPRKKTKWKGEDAFIQSRSFYVPKSGDTLDFHKLNDVEQDYAIGYLRDKGEKITIKTTLWQGEHEINLDRVGATKIANRQVSLNEVDFLPWQDRFLIETQIRQSEPGNAPISLKREIFRDSTQPIHKIEIQDDCYYLVCNKGSNCPDSRETGYVTKNKIEGSYMELPTRIQNGVIAPAVRKVQTAGRLISELFSQAVNSITELLNSDTQQPDKK